MPKPVEITTAYGRRYLLVGAGEVLSPGEDEALALVRAALAESSEVDALRRYFGERGADADADELARLLARELASGALVAIATDDGLTQGMWSPSEHDDWDDIPSLSELRPSETNHSLTLEIVDYTGLPYAELEVFVRDASGEARRVVLDDRGRWSADDLIGPGAVAVDLPPRMQLPPRMLRAQPLQGFVGGSADVPVTRQPRRPLSLRLDQAHRVVVQAPVAQPTTSFPSTLFASESSFPGPGIAHFIRYAQELTDRDLDARIGIFGHTDTTDDVQSNKLLAERRAQAAYALLTGEYEPFAAVAATEQWGLGVYQSMLRVLGCNPGAIDGEPGVQTSLAVNVFRRDYNRDAWHRGGRPRVFGTLPEGDELDAATLNAIVDAYHAEMSGRVKPARFAGPKHVGCGELNPIGDSHADNRRVTLAIYGADAPDAADYPCSAGDAAACQVDEGGVFRCRFYRERIREQSVTHELFPFWDFEWLRTHSGKAHLSVLTHLADTNDARFVVRRARPEADAQDSGDGPAPTDGREIAVVPGLIRNGVAYALWELGVVDPFAVSKWFDDAASGSLLREYAPYFFTVAAHDAWGRGAPPSYALERVTLSDASGPWAVGLTPPGDIVLVAPAELAAAEDRRVAAVRVPARATGAFQR
ncbi:MAG: hypothetical protein IAG13_17145 [Deltaproteobacteria bacterium]|nr:hypothetical protein [Nannocystaceae bacterium]